MNDIALYYNKLTDEQELCINYLALDMPILQVSNITKIPQDRIRMWLNSDNVFQAHLATTREQKSSIIQKQLDKAGILATNYAIKILSNEVETNDFEGRRIQKDIAKSMLSILASKKVEVKLSTQNEDKMDNIDDASRAIVNQYSNPDAPQYVVVNNAQLLIDEPILHKDTKMGEINIDVDHNQIQCHICGKWENDLVVHIRTSHGMSPIRYRELYKIPDDISFYIEDVVDANND